MQMYNMSQIHNGELVETYVPLITLPYTPNGTHMSQLLHNPTPLMGHICPSRPYTPNGTYMSQ